MGMSTTFKVLFNFYKKTSEHYGWACLDLEVTGHKIFDA